MKHLFIALFSCLAMTSYGQIHKPLKDYEADAEYENVYVMKLTEDPHQSTYIIWVKDSVSEHYHASHTENIVVISGKAKMTLDGEEITIKKGDFLSIPEGTKHAVVEVFSHNPLKVLSTQMPVFKGKDRIYTKKEE